MSESPAAFHHADLGTPEGVWLGSNRWDAVPSLDLAAVVTRFPRLLVVSAHPDDETLGVGALLSDAAAAGAEVVVLVATDGERSHPTTNARARAALGHRRRLEVERALGTLAPRVRTIHLGCPDGALEDHEQAMGEAVRRLAEPGTLVLAPWHADGHADHDAVGRACAAALAGRGAALAYYPVWLWHWGSVEALPWAQAVAVEPSATASWRKRAALEHFSSQTTPWSGPEGVEHAPAPVVGAAVLTRARRLTETLIDPDGVVPTVPAASADREVAARSERFDGMYDGASAGDQDPWGFAASFYEERRRHLVTAMLGSRRYDRVLEVGCADGRLTALLAERAGEVVAIDTSARAVAVARERAPGAVVRHGVAPTDLPAGPFDLVVLSEVGYFLTPLELLATLRRSEASLAPGGELLLCHWQHPTTGVPLDGALVHEQAAAMLCSDRLATYVDGDLRIEVWGDADSLAQREGRT